jgi:hypothetical protein
MKKEIAILGVAGLVLLLISMPYASATTTINGPFIQGQVPPLQPADSIPEDSPFVVQVTTDLTVESAHINVTFPPELELNTVHPDPLVSFDFSRYQDGALSNGAGGGWVDVIAAEAAEIPLPVAPLLAEIGFLTTVEGTYTISLTSVINGVEDDVVPLEVTVIAVPGDVNGDGIVNYRDIVEVIEHWGDPVSCPTCDVDRDGDVGYSDISFILGHWTGS